MKVLNKLLFSNSAFKNVSRLRYNSSLSNLRNINQNVVSSFSSDVLVPEVSITDWVYSKMEPFNKYTAVESADTGKKYTFFEVKNKANNLCKALKRNWNLEKGDVVAIMLSNSPDFFVVGLGILEAGLVCTTINPVYNSDEIAKQLLDSSVKLVITQSQCFREIQKACEKIKKEMPIICVKHSESENLPRNAINLEEIINKNIDETTTSVVDHNDLAVLLYSSGTTGSPKGVELTHKNFITILSQYQHPDFRCAVAATVLFLTTSPEVKSKYLESLRIVMTGAAPFGELDEHKFLKKLGRSFTLHQGNQVEIEFLQSLVTKLGYGLTETTGIAATTLFYQNVMDTCKGSTGTLPPNCYLKVIKVDDSSGTPLGPNETGEILVKSSQIMTGYFNKPEQTKEVFLDGWFRTGDMGHYNEGGQLLITDRLKELIKVKGFQVAPAELEDIIRDIPNVLDAAVIGVPHPTFGEAPRAYVVPKPDVRIQPEDIAKYVASKLAKFKHLAGGVELIDVIPKSLSGKILRKNLKLNYLERNS